MKGAGLVEQAGVDGRERLFLRRRPDEVAPFYPSVGDGTAYPLCVFSGVDSLALYYPPGPIELAWLRLLDSAKAAAQDPDNRAGHLVEMGPYSFEVEPYGAKGGFRWVLGSPVLRMQMKSDGSVYVHFRSVLLTALGPARAVEEVTAILGHTRKKDFEGVRRVGEPTVSRIDLCRDLRTPVWGREEMERMVTRARLRPTWGVAARVEGRPVGTKAIEKAVQELLKAEGKNSVEQISERVLRALGARVWREEDGELRAQHEVEAEYFRGGENTGFSLGKGQLMFRVYDKLAELKRSGKTYMKRLWEKAGWNHGPVTRIEFQIRKKALSTFDQIRERGRYWSVVADCLPAIWGYLTGSWLTLRTKTADKQRSRWPIDPIWEKVQAMGWGAVEPVRRASLGRPARWVIETVENERDRKPVKAAGRRATQRERVRVEARRRLYRPAPGCEVLRESEAAKERVLLAGLSGYLASLFALTGKGPAACAERAARRPQYIEQVKVARARVVLRGAEALAI